MEAAAMKKPHAVCFPFPAQGHINPMIKLAKLLHHKGFHITFVHTDYNYNRLLKTNPDSLKSSPDFHFETISDGLPPAAKNVDRDVVEVWASIVTHGVGAFRDLLNKINNNNNIPPVSCVVSDGNMLFTIQVTDQMGLPNVALWVTSAFVVMCCLHFPHLRERGYSTLKDESYFTNGYMEKTIDWIPGIDSIRLKDIPDAIWTTDPECPYVDNVISEVSRIYKASAVILNTFDALESNILKALSSIVDKIYPIGPLDLLLKEVSNNEENDGIQSNLWKTDDDDCIEWLNSKDEKSVIYVNYGSTTTMSQEHFVEFAFGLANSKQNFLWIVRPNLVTGGQNLLLPEEFLAEIKDRGKIVSWCNQKEIIKHPSIGGFLTHCGWNSVIESLAAGVPMICWPFIFDQPTNCFCLCNNWGVGIELEKDVKRSEVERVVRELMIGEKGKELKKNALEWKKKAEAATGLGGSSYMNLDRLVEEVLLSP
ncbi:hypothetical protein M9H77_19717 [Catharanthus roseus]|uniref:Uncharacterized protein n=1 Tax=Catharanthus roseus TaxID=4058 RepID=A0ACC0BB75_CATRO|nr:hypothetical protein M9H77_19717 [Catharanthus roseus]